MHKQLLTRQQVDAYHQDGYLSPLEVMTESQAAGHLAALEQAETDYGDVLTGAGRNNLHLVFDFLDAITHHENILDAVESIIGPDILVCGTVLFAKQPQNRGYVSWHQDGTYMGIEPPRGVTAWLALTESTVESGCMRMIPGSHTGGIVAHHDTFADHNILTRGQAVDGIDETQAVELELRPGQMSLHHMCTVHASNENRSLKRRVGFAIQSYIRPDMLQTRGTSYAQLARGKDRFNNLPRLERCGNQTYDQRLAIRQDVNRQWSDILYYDSNRRRNY